MLLRKIIKLNKNSDIIQNLICNYNSHLYSNGFYNIIIYISHCSQPSASLQSVEKKKYFRLHGVDNGLVELVLHSVKIFRVEITFGEFGEI